MLQNLQAEQRKDQRTGGADEKHHDSERTVQRFFIYTFGRRCHRFFLPIYGSSYNEVSGQKTQARGRTRAAVLAVFVSPTLYGAFPSHMRDFFTGRKNGQKRGTQFCVRARVSRSLRRSVYVFSQLVEILTDG